MLHNLPHTVHGMGRAVLGSHLSFSQDDDDEHLQLGNLAGYMVVASIEEDNRLPHVESRVNWLTTTRLVHTQEMESPCRENRAAWRMTRIYIRCK